MKINDTPFLFKATPPILPNLHFYVKNLNPHLLKNFQKLNPYA